MSETQIIPIDILKSGARELGIELSDEQVADLSAFAQLLLDWNEKFNLTRITEPQEIVVKHLLDSLSCLSAVEFPQDARVLDVGTGAGLPGIPLKIARPDLHMTLMDATRKKLTFIEAVVHELGLQDTKIVHARAEEAAHDMSMRERFDIVTARAVSELRVLAEYTLPYAKPGAAVIAQKGPDVDTEVAAAQKAVAELGGSIERVVQLTLPGSDAARSLVVIKKTSPTPRRYPRKQAEISKKPL